MVRKGNLFTPAQAEMHDAAQEKERDNKRQTKAEEQYRAGRESASRALREAKRSGVVQAFKLLVSENDCDVCQRVKSKTIPLSQCTIDMLPPFNDCEYEEGCRASYTEVLGDAYNPSKIKLTSGTPSRSKKKGGLLLMILRLFFPKL